MTTVINYRVEPKREMRGSDLIIPDLRTLQQFSLAFLTHLMQQGLLK